MYKQAKARYGDLDKQIADGKKQANQQTLKSLQLTGFEVRHATPALLSIIAKTK